MLWLLMSACTQECPAGSSLQEDGLCHLDDDTAPVDDTAPDSGIPATDTAEPVTWITLPEVCQAPESLPADPLTVQGSLFVQDEVLAELIDVEIDTARGVAVAGGSGGGSDRAGGVMLFDISGDDPVFLSADTPEGFMNRTYHVELGPDQVVYATHRDHGLAVTLTADRGHITSQADPITEPDLSGMASTDTHLYVTTHAGELLTYDITEPTDPTLLSRTGGLGNAWAPHLLGDRLYVADNTEGVIVVDRADPDAPTVLRAVAASGGVQDIAFSADGAALYAAVGGAGVEVFDLTDPDTPVSIGLLDVRYSVISVAVDGDTLWAVDQQDVVAFDVADPFSPVLVNTEQTEQWAMHVAAAEGRSLVADWGYLAAYAVDATIQSPDLVVGAAQVFLDAEGELEVPLSNLGAGSLSLLGATVEGADLTASVSAEMIAPAGQGTLRLSAGPGFTGATVCLTTDDPDAPLASLEVVGRGAGEAGLGVEAPDFTLTGIDGKDYTLSDQRGRPVVLVYFATW